MDHPDLEQRLSRLEHRLLTLEDRAAVENLMARYAFYFSAGQGRRIVPELWSRDDEASLEYGASGVYRNLWKVKTFYVNAEIPGYLQTCTLASQWLKISESGTEARGAWMAVCTETDAGDLSAQPPTEGDQRRILLSSRTENGQAYRAEVLLQKYEVLFRKEEGQWRIFRLHVSEFFRCPAGSDWVRYAKTRQVTDGMWLESLFETPDPIPSFENLPNGPTTYHWQYDTDVLPELQFPLED